LGRILLLLIIAFAIYLLFRAFLKSQAKKDSKPDLPAEGEKMVTCANCGVNLPTSSTQEKDGKRVCRDNPHCLPPA
jgi:hypothetical protein